MNLPLTHRRNDVMWQLLVVAAGLLLTTATQLRADGVPIGIGEICLAAFIGWRLVVLMLTPLQHRDDAGAKVYGLFWICFVTLVSIGFYFAILRGLWDSAGASHDAFSLAFSGVLSVLLLSFLDEKGKVLQLLSTLFWLCAAVMTGLLILAAFRKTFIGIDPWYAAIRFTGWAKNPNQIGLLMAAMPFVGLWSVRRTNIGRRTCFAVALMVVFIAGILSQSDALYVGWLGAFLVVAVLVWLDTFFRTDIGRIRSLLIAVVIPGLLLIVSILMFETVVERLEVAIVDRYALGDQGGFRFTIWSHGIDALAANPLLGHGPGAFSGALRPFSGYEAHNTYIDLATKGGLLLTLLFVAMLLATLVRLIALREYWLIGAMVSMLLFCVFHYVLRQPIFWVVLIACIRVAWGQPVKSTGAAPRMSVVGL